MEDENRRSLARRQQDLNPSDFNDYPSDEISLYDLWDILVRRIWWIIGVGAVVVLLALAHALTKPTEYEFTSVIELGGMLEAEGSERIRYLEPDTAFLQRLTNIYVPTAREALREANAEASIPRVSITRGDGGALFLLKSTVSEAGQELVSDLHLAITAQATASHEVPYRQARLNRRERLTQVETRLAFQQDERFQGSRIRSLEEAALTARLNLDSLRSKQQMHRMTLENRLRVLQLSLADRKNQRELLEVQQRRLEQQRKLLETHIETAMAFSRGMTTGAGNSLADLNRNATPEGMVGLFLSAQTDQARRRVEELEARLFIDLPDRADTLTISLDENRTQVERQEAALTEVRAELGQLDASESRELEIARAKLDSAQAAVAREQADLELEISELESEVNLAGNFLEQVTLTRATRVAVRSMEPAGTGKALILALGIVLGGMLGIFAAFMVEFVSNARKRNQAA